MIRSLHVENITVFPRADFTFSRGLNVITGANGTGKSHILKLAYAILQAFTDEEARKNFGLSVSLGFQLMSKFRVTFIEDLMRLHAITPAKVRLTDTHDDDIEFQLHLPKDSSGMSGKTDDHEEMPRLDSIFHSIQQTEKSLFLPPKEILSVYRGFRSALKNRELAFDGTYLDLAEALDQAPFKEAKLKEIEHMYRPLEDIIHAKAFLQNYGEFAFAVADEHASSGVSTLPADMFAEGHRKLGMLAYLIKNGSLAEGSTLFWDEPEANLNPLLIRQLADVLATLSRDVQIIIATHSLFLLRELNILRILGYLTDTHYMGLYFTEDGVAVRQGDAADDIGDIAALIASLDQSQRYMSATSRE